MAANPKQEAYQYYLSIGYQPHQAAAIVGSLQQESQFNPNAVGDQGTAFGIGQWRHDRFDRLKQFANQRGTNWNDFGTQLAYLDWEMKNTERKAGDRLRSSGNVNEALNAAYDFWRPAASRAVETQKRLRYAAPLLNSKSSSGGKVARSSLPSPDNPVPFPPRRPHSPTPGIDAPQYAADSPYFRPPAPDAASVLPAPQPKPEQGFDWGGALAGASGLFNALGGQQNDQQQLAQQATLQRMQQSLDEAAQRRKAWNQQFTWF